MSKIYFPVYKAGEDEFVITASEAVFKSKESAEEEAINLLKFNDVVAPAKFERIMELDSEEGLTGIYGNFMFLNVFYISGPLSESKDFADEDTVER